MDDDFWRTLPTEFDTTVYRSLYSDLAPLTGEQLQEHYTAFGRTEGRMANRVHNRNEFAALIPESATVLEVGPFNRPMLRGPNVFYFDVLSENGLVARAKSIGLDPSGVPHIHYVSAVGDLSIIDRQFDAVISSHCLEHQPDMIRHLKEISRLLHSNGAYLLLLPDKRYCFDHFIPLSNIAEIIAAHHERRTIHTLRSVIEHRALTTHNDSARHWREDHGIYLQDFRQRLERGLQEFADAKGAYIDVHAWYLTPDSAAEILSTLHRIGVSPFGVARIYPTRNCSIEFWMILRKLS